MITKNLSMALAAITAFAAPISTAQNEALQPRQIQTGITDLLETSRALVGYRLEGADQETILGAYWRGFDRASGVRFEHYALGAGRKPALFMHCPYVKGPGTAFARFPLVLPAVSPVTLELAIGLRFDAPESDGVTYGVRVNNRLLYEEHCTWKGLKNRTVDLSDYAGKVVELQLDVSPGPQLNTRDDWSLWGNARILAGTEQQLREARERAAKQEAKKQHADLQRGETKARASLITLADPRVKTVCPSTLRDVRHEMLLSENGHTQAFAQDSRDKIRFEMNLDTVGGTSIPIGVEVNGTPMEPHPVRIRLRPAVNGKEITDPPLSSRIKRIRQTNEGVDARWTQTFAGCDQPHVVDARLSLQGKSLRVELSAVTGSFAGTTVTMRGGTAVPAVYGLTPTDYFPAPGVYASVTPDIWHANAGSINHSGSRYPVLTDGTRRPLHDVFYVTFSSRYEETLPNVPHAPSPFLHDLSHRLVLDVWGGHFADDATWLTGMQRYGLDSFVIIKHVWQRDGYDRSYPNTMPANARQGGDASLNRLALTAKSIGHRFCVHENYYDYYPNAESFLPEHCALSSKGERIPGWDRGPVKAVILKPSKLMEYARQFSPEIRKRYACNAAYHDIMPTWRVDYDAKVPESGMIRVTHAATKQLCEYHRKLFTGPVLFEAATPQMAGVYDGGTANGRRIEHFPLAPATELLKVHTKMANHGMSYYERWLQWGYGPGWGTYIMTDRELDKYRAMTIAFGRVGFVGHQLMPNHHGVVREYYLMQAFGRAYTGRKPTHIRYLHADTQTWIDPGTAARYGFLQRLRVTYEDNQEVFVNGDDSDWDIGQAVLPPHGTFTTGPRATAWTARVGEQIADYVHIGDTVYADARSHVWQPETKSPSVEARVAEFRDLGKGKISLALEWMPRAVIDRDLLVFWHFRCKGKIAFQTDHRTKPRTTEWKPGATILDGPIALTLPDGYDSAEYKLVVGLYDTAGRWPVLGAASEMLLGTLKVSGGNETAKSVSLKPAPHPFPAGSDPRPYLVDSNRARAVLRFPEVATNGAVIVTLPTDASEALALVPVPLGTVMTIGTPGEDRPVLAVNRRTGRTTEIGKQSRDGWTSFKTTADPDITYRVLDRKR